MSKSLSIRRSGSSRNIWFVTTTLIVGSLAVSMTVDMPKKLIWNASPSVPIGLYWIRNTVPKQGDIALVELPEGARNFADVEGVLPRNVPALKKISAINGDRVCRFGSRIFINSRLVAKAYLRDFRGRKLPEWRGCHTLKSHEIFLLNDHPKSFDSRYFGSVKLRSVTGIAVPIWTQ